MLQWMGGSRRKVNASRGSKQKRQKQYFEQRKRQQCQNITSSVDNFVDGYKPCRLNPKEKRSLDVLSLHSLSQVAEGCSLACADGILEIDPFPDKSTKTRTLPKLIGKIVTSVNNAETLQITELGNISNNPKPSMPEEKIGPSNLYNSTLEGNPDGEELKDASDHQFEDMSVFELIDEDGKSRNKSEDDTEYEAHVAFSMQGLGKVGTETPLNSPQPSRRILSDDQSGLFKAARRQFPLYSCRNFENLLEDHEMDVESMMENDDVFSNGKYLSSDWGQSGSFGSYGHAEPDFLKYSSTGLYGNNPRVKYFDDKENFGDIHEFRADFLEVCPSFPDGSSFNEKLDISCENTCFTDIYNTSSHEADFTEDCSFAKRKSYRDQYGRTGRFWDLDFSSQHPQHQLTEDCDFLKSDHSNASYFTANKFINAGAKQSRYSYLKADDPMDNFSSLSSGESCSSSFWSTIPRKAKSIIDDEDDVPSRSQSINPPSAVPSQSHKPVSSASATQFSSKSFGSREATGQNPQKSSDGARLHKGFGAIANSLTYIGGTISNALEEGLTIVETCTADIIHETRKLNVRKKFGTPDVNDQDNKDRNANNKTQMQTSVQPQMQSDLEIQLKASRDVSMAMAAKTKFLLRELKTVKADLAFAKERCAQLEEENKLVRESLHKGDSLEDESVTFCHFS